MSKPIYYVGQAVGCLMLGEGVIESIKDLFIYVNFDGVYRTFYKNGAYYEYARPTLYPIDQYREIIANLPAPQPEPWKPKPGEWCWFWDDPTHNPRVGKFAGFDANMTYPYLTSIGYRWIYCAPFIGELPEHLKEVQP